MKLLQRSFDRDRPARATAREPVLLRPRSAARRTRPREGALVSEPLPFGLEEPRHPNGRELTDVERHLLRVRLIGHEANKLFCSAVRDEHRKADTELVFTLHNYSLILICRFLEIWGDFSAEGKRDPRVFAATRLCEPLLSRINVWPGLVDYRNWIMAHRYRWNKRPELITPWAVLHSGRVPSKPAEWFVLLECVRFASAAAIASFGPLILEIEQALHIGEEPIQPHGAQSPEEAEVERRRLAGLMDRRMVDAGVDPGHPIVRTLVCKPPVT